MKPLFFSTKELDKRAVESFKIPNIVLMENAARGMFSFLKKLKKQKIIKAKKPKILLLCGCGDNGADALALARMACKKFSIFIYAPMGAKSQLCKEQLKILKEISKNNDIVFLNELDFSFDFCCIVDALFGIGFKGVLDNNLQEIITKINALNALKIACDIPSGIAQDGSITSVAFKADFTLTMGALKCALFLDSTADFIGKVKLIDLGIPKEIFNTKSDINLLQKKDCKIPNRQSKNTNKGDFGHLCVFLGEKQGAGILCANAALRSGCALVSVLTKNTLNLEANLMQTNLIPQNTSAIALGMGFGRDSTLKEKIPTDTALLLDADIFYNAKFKKLLEHKNIVLTPHPKEFTQILKALKIADISTKELQNNRISYALKFSNAYPHIVLVLKGAHSIIAHKNKLYINPFCNAVLSKGGSGDVLAGIISALLAQGKSPIESAISGVLLHSKIAKKYAKKYNDFSLTPLDLIKELRYI